LANLCRVTRDDLVLVTRAWSPLFEIIYNHKNIRPTVIQLSDGLVFNINSQAKKNRRYGGMYNKNLFDETILFNGPCREFPYRFEISSNRKYIPSLRNVLLVLGNDFAFDDDKNHVLESLAEIKPKCDSYEYYVSTTDSDAEAFFLKKGFNVTSVSELNERDTLIVSTPSTYFLELARKGFLVSLHKRYIDKYFESIIVDHESALDTRFASDIEFTELAIGLNVVKRTEKYAICKRYFLRYLLGDLRELFRF
jgi:hypothetical protein